MADKFLEVIKERTPVGKSTWGERVGPTGLTRKSWTIHILQNDANGVRWTINADGREDIVFFLEYGTKPHIILPKMQMGDMGSYGSSTPWASRSSKWTAS